MVYLKKKYMPLGLKFNAHDIHIFLNVAIFLNAAKVSRYFLGPLYISLHLYLSII